MTLLTPLEDQERDKYRRMWERPEYRERSPGQRLVPVFLDYITTAYGSGLYSITDYGCGTGRATAALRDAGHTVLGVDFAPNALEEDVPFVDACLWRMGDQVPVSDFAFCADVMEHIPHSEVLEVFKAIRERTKALACFAISWGDDDCGRLIGEELHITKLPLSWWLDSMRSVGYSIVRHEPGDRPNKQVIFAIA